MKMTVFWNVAPYNLIEIDWHFIGAYCTKLSLPFIHLHVISPITMLNLWLQNIPASGQTLWCTLEKKGKAKKQGDVKIRLSFSSEKNSQVASQEHRHLLRLMLLHELENSKVCSPFSSQCSLSSACTHTHTPLHIHLLVTNELHTVTMCVFPVYLHAHFTAVFFYPLQCVCFTLFIC
jgi:hypothetical protein